MPVLDVVIVFVLVVDPVVVRLTKAELLASGDEVDVRLVPLLLVDVRVLVEVLVDLLVIVPGKDLYGVYDDIEVRVEVFELIADLVGFTAKMRYGTFSDIVRARAVEQINALNSIWQCIPIYKSIFIRANLRRAIQLLHELLLTNVL